jgi:SET domain-containing protein
MTFRASRDIAAGEECTIGYFDLAEHVDVIARQKFLENWFTFVCSCKRCNEEAAAQAA